MAQQSESSKLLDNLHGKGDECYNMERSGIKSWGIREPLLHDQGFDQTHMVHISVSTGGSHLCYSYLLYNSTWSPVTRAGQ